MNKSVKAFLFVVMVLPNILNGDERRSHNRYKAFKNCKGNVCAARVSFCIIMKDCGCGASIKDGEFCHCCEDCFRCLGTRLWRKCCGCVGLCSVFSLNNTGNGPGIPSKFGDLPGHSLPTLFEAMSSGSNLPVVFISRPRRGGLMKPGPSPSPQHQCKVAFFDKCITKEDCLDSCSSMGAHRYRWFRNGCCQCIDKRCHDYGELKPLCKNCQAN